MTHLWIKCWREGVTWVEIRGCDRGIAADDVDLEVFLDDFPRAPAGLSGEVLGNAAGALEDVVFGCDVAVVDVRGEERGGEVSDVVGVTEEGGDAADWAEGWLEQGFFCVEELGVSLVENSLEVGGDGEGLKKSKP